MSLYSLGLRGTRKDRRKTVAYLQKMKVLLPRMHVRIFKASKTWGHIPRKMNNSLVRRVEGRKPRKVA